MSHYGDGGIQNDSIGDYYPGGTYIKAGLEPGGTIVAWNFVTGEVYGEVEFDNWGESYYKAHAIADALIPKDVPYRKKRRQHVAEVEPSTDVSTVRRNVMSKYSIPASERILSDEFFVKVNSRRVVLELISYCEGIVERNQQEWADFQQSDHAGCEDCTARAKALVELNQFVLDGLVAVVSQADARTQEVREADASSDPFQDLIQQLAESGVIAVGNRS